MALETVGRDERSGAMVFDARVRTLAGVRSGMSLQMMGSSESLSAALSVASVATEAH